MKLTINKYTATGSFLFIFIVWIGWPWLLNIWTPYYDNRPPNEFGDSFGAISALFTGLAFSGLVISLFMQRDDFDQSIEQMKKQNELTANAMYLSLYPTVFNQKLRDLEDILLGWGGYEKMEELNIDTVTKAKIHTWISALERDFVFYKLAYKLKVAEELGRIHHGGHITETNDWPLTLRELFEEYKIMADTPGSNHYIKIETVEDQSLLNGFQNELTLAEWGSKLKEAEHKIQVQKLHISVPKSETYSDAERETDNTVLTDAISELEKIRLNGPEHDERNASRPDSYFRDNYKNSIEIAERIASETIKTEQNYLEHKNNILRVKELNDLFTSWENIKAKILKDLTAS